MITKRQTEILQMLANGHNRETAAHNLGISIHTTRAHIADLKLRLRVGTTPQAVAEGIRKGIIQ